MLQTETDFPRAPWRRCRRGSFYKERAVVSLLLNITVVCLTRKGGVMPPRGVKKGTKRARQYEHVKASELEQGRSESLAEEIAARTVNKERARAGESRERSRSSTDDISSGRRGGLRSGTERPKGRTFTQLYNEAKHLGIEGRSTMNKAALQRAVDSRKH
jgi:hypothetical protein